MDKIIDPHNHKKTYLKWKEAGSQIKGVTDDIRTTIIAYLNDMEIGANVSPSVKKGPRSYGRLRNQKTKLRTLFIIFQEELGIKKVIDLENKEIELLYLAKRMREGEIKSKYNNKPLKAIGTYFTSFKAFWNWFIRTNNKKGKTIKNILQDVDTRDDKPRFNYLTAEQVKKLTNSAQYEYKVLITFLFDTGIRAPKELMNVRAKHITWNEKKKYCELEIIDESSKTFGRRIKLLKSGELVSEYIKNKQLKPDEPLFQKRHQSMNKYLRILGYKVLGIGKGEIRTYTTKRGDKKEDLLVKEGISLYDFRHSSACFWLPRYKTESGLKYRFGWKKSEMIYYYTELLGMRDTLEQEDLYTDTSKTELEKELQEEREQRLLLEEKQEEMEQKLKLVTAAVTAMQEANSKS